MNARQKTVRAAGMSIIVKAGIKQVSNRYQRGKLSEHRGNGR